MQARYVQGHLRRCGVVVHHAARMPSTADGRESVVVYLESGLQQYELARRCVLKLPGVIGVTFSGHTPSIMYVFGNGPGGSDRRHRPEQLRAKPGPGPGRSPGSVPRRTTSPQRN